jgi:hexosaminidase
VIASLAATAAVFAAPKIEVDYQEFAGLQVKINGVHVIQGSAFQYYEEGWKRGIYSSNWRPKQIEKLPNAGLRVRFEGDNGNVVGFQTYERTMTGVKAVHEYRWRGEGAIRLENCLALLWGPALEKGSLRIDGKAGLAMDRPFPGRLPIWDKQFGPAGGSFVADTPFATVNVKVSPGQAILFDARGHNQAWAENRELFWLGFIDQKLEPRQTLRYEVEWDFQLKGAAPKESAEPQPLTSQPLSRAVRPLGKQLPLIPAPKKRTLGAGDAILGPNLVFDLAERHLPLREEFERMLWRRWQRSSLPPSEAPAVIEGRVAPLGLPAEGYRVEVKPSRILLTGQDEQGLRHAFRTLVWLAQAKGEKLVAPSQTIQDWPSLRWRGLHMFVGPTALGLQTRLMDHYFGPLKVNHVVIQCERTEWKSLPGIETPITMKREDLRELFARYRQRGIEPIPLIQSLGHTYWVFQNGQNLDIAINPDEPFTLDPRKDRTRRVLKDLWTEAIDLLNPKTIHFGLDEIDMRGIPDDPNFSTRLWNLHVPWLLDLAAEKGVAPMMWGDIMLGPGEAPDAFHAKTREAALARRKIVRPGTFIADWHYLENPDPSVYNSLEVFKKAGFRPIASTWDRPNNVRGFALAAIQNGAEGLLQTTWAGYESSESALIREFDQFSAYVLAADYAWSGRQELPAKLPYDPREVLTRLFFSPPEPVNAASGGSLSLPSAAVSSGQPPAVQVGPASFRLFAPLGLHTPVSAEGMASPLQRSFILDAKAKEVILAIDATAWTPDNEPLARIEAVLDSGAVVSAEALYGRHARAPRDPRPTLLSSRSRGLSAFRLSVADEEGAPQRVRQIRLTGLSPAGGLRVHGVTWVAE